METLPIILAPIFVTALVLFGSYEPTQPLGRTPEERAEKEKVAREKVLTDKILQSSEHGPALRAVNKSLKAKGRFPTKQGRPDIKGLLR